MFSSSPPRPPLPTPSSKAHTRGECNSARQTYRPGSTGQRGGEGRVSSKRSFCHTVLNQFFHHKRFSTFSEVWDGSNRILKTIYNCTPYKRDLRAPLKTGKQRTALAVLWDIPSAGFEEFFSIYLQSLCMRKDSFWERLRGLLGMPKCPAQVEQAPNSLINVVRSSITWLHYFWSRLVLKVQVKCWLGVNLQASALSEVEISKPIIRHTCEPCIVFTGLETIKPQKGLQTEGSSRFVQVSITCSKCGLKAYLQEDMI